MSFSESKSHSGSWLWRIFCSVFLIIGIWMFCRAAGTVVDWTRIQNWEPTKARVTAADLDSKRSDDTTVYQATATYVYEVAGRQYTNQRVGIRSGHDNLGEYHQRRAAELRKLVRTEKATTCFVNPSDPTQAVLFRDLRAAPLFLSLLMGVLFSTIGGGLAILFRVGEKKSARNDELRAEFPDEPWNWRDDWNEGVILSSCKLVTWMLGFAAIVWNLLSWPVVLVVPGELRGGNYLVLIALVFPLVGIGFIYWAVVLVLRYRRFGESRLQLATLPGIVGGPLAGVIRTNCNLEASDGFKQTLLCEKTTRERSGGKSRTVKRILWQDVRVMEREMASEDLCQSVIPVQFAIPFDAQPSSGDSAGNSTIEWRLNVEANVPGVDFHATFEVPVFQTTESSADYVEDHAAVGGYLRQRSVEAVCAEQAIQLQPTSRGFDLVFPLFRHLGLNLGTTLFVSIWCAAAIGLVWAGEWFIAGIFGMCGTFMLYWLIDTWMWRSRVSVSDSRVSIAAGWLPRQQDIQAADIQSIHFSNGMQAGQTLYYNMHIKTKAGRRFCFGKRVQSEATARAIKQKMEAELGLSSSTA